MSRKILVIDDDTLVTQTVKNLLERKGYRTTVSHSGQAALDLIAHDDFDLVLCDIRMPGFNGIETVEEIKRFLKDQDRQDVPTFFLTGYADDENFEKAQALGEVLLKPYDIHELIGIVQRHLGEKENL